MGRLEIVDPERSYEVVFSASALAKSKSAVIGQT